MEKRQMKLSPINIISYFLGFFILGFAVISILRSNLGAGAWDTTNANLNAFMNVHFTVIDIGFRTVPITLGVTSMMISLTIMTIVLLYRKDVRLLLMFLPIGLVALTIDFWDIVVYQEYQAVGLMRPILYVVGGLLLPFGLSLIVLSNFPAFVFDELMLMLMDVFNTKKIGGIRLGIEILGIGLGILFGVLAGIGLGAVNIGSIILAIVLGPIMSFYIKTLQPYYQKKNART
jgi:uncharacterized membrane protein YczE